MCSGSSRWRLTATGMRCWSGWTRPAAPATPATGRVSTPERSRRPGGDPVTGSGGQPAGRSAARREYALCLAIGAAGAAIVLLAVRQGWARVLTVAPAPLPATSVTVTGQDLVPVAGALGIASLAGLAAVVATRSRLRRLT